MKELLDKLSSYNIFNYLLPGTIFAFLAEKVSSYTFLHENIVIGGFIYYFFGLVISRIGSVTIEPILKGLKLITFAPYKDYLEAVKTDTRIETLSEANNMYRTLVAMSASLLALIIFELATKKFEFLQGGEATILIVSIFVLFLFAYRKQTKYIRDRIDHNKS